jgi:hypothetical protein
MSETKYHYFTGPVMFAMVFEGNRDRGEYAPEGGQYTIDIGIKDKKDIKKIKSWNSNYKARTYKGDYGDDAEADCSYFQFKRKHILKNKETGELIDDWCGPPTVLNKDNEEWGADTGVIGNGSVCTVKLAVSDGAFIDSDGKPRTVTFVRLESLRVEEWVKYEAPDSDETEDDEDDSDVDTDDEIPF